MTERERLIKLLDECIAIKEMSFAPDEPLTTATLADYLMSKGVICPPCKVGDVVYVIWKDAVYPVRAYAIRCDFKKREQRVCVEGTFHFRGYDRNYSATFTFNSFGRTVFLTREEAEAALAERRKA